MQDLKKLFLFLAVISLFSSGIVSTAPAFADDDDDEKKKDKNKDKITKLQKECAKEPKKPYKIKPECELLNLINDSAPDPRADSFFDVFFDIENYSVDSFFDIFTELQTSSSRADSFFDVFFDIENYSVDSFFDIFTELQTDVDTIETEIVALDLRGESCPDGEILTGVNLDGTLACTPSGTGNPFVDIQQNIDDKTSEIMQIQTDMVSISSGIANFQSQLDDLLLSPSERQACVSSGHAYPPGDPRIHPDYPSCTYNDRPAADVLLQQISDLQLQLDLLNEQLVDSKFELMVLQTLQNQLDNSGDPIPDCNDANLCTIDFFDPTSGMCANLPNDGLSCNDGDVTTQNDVCGASMCVGTPIICDDGNPDTVDSLDMLTGECIFTLIDNDGDGFGPSVDCDDNNPVVNPNAIEVVGDGIDNNCDGITDNLAPIVNAGLDQIVPHGSQDVCTTTFVGTASDPDGDSLTFQWSKTGGFNVNFDSQNSLTTDVSLIPIRPTVTYTSIITLTVSDGLQSSSDSVLFTCTP